MFRRIRWPMSPAPTRVPETEHLRGLSRILDHVSLTVAIPNCSSAPGKDPRSMKRSGRSGSKGLRPRCSFPRQLGGHSPRRREGIAQGNRTGGLPGSCSLAGLARLDRGCGGTTIRRQAVGAVFNPSIKFWKAATIGRCRDIPCWEYLRLKLPVSPSSLWRQRSLSGPGA